MFSRTERAAIVIAFVALVISCTDVTGSGEKSNGEGSIDGGDATLADTIDDHYVVTADLNDPFTIDLSDLDSEHRDLQADVVWGLTETSTVTTAFEDETLRIQMSEYGRYVLRIRGSLSGSDVSKTFELIFGPVWSNSGAYMDVNATTSYVLSNEFVPATYTQLSGAMTYIDIDQDSDLDIILALMTYDDPSNPIVVLLNDGQDNFSSGTFLDYVDTVADVHHPRKILKQDFNGDGVVDFIILDHGWETDPGDTHFDGANHFNHLYLSSLDGTWTLQELTQWDRFHHGGAAGDIDRDGDVDLFIMGGHDNHYILWNDGTGNFTYDENGIIDTYAQSLLSTTFVELYDIDSDGYLDLVTGFHQSAWYQPAEDVRNVKSARVYWGSDGHRFALAYSSVLPFVENYGVTLDFDFADVDGDGSTEIVVLRTGDELGTVGFYEQNYLNAVDIVDRRLENIHGLFIPEEFGFTYTSGSVSPYDGNGDGLIDFWLDYAADLNPGDYKVFLNTGTTWVKQ